MISLCPKNLLNTKAQKSLNNAELFPKIASNHLVFVRKNLQINMEMEQLFSDKNVVTTQIQIPKFYFFSIRSYHGRMVACWLHMQRDWGSNPVTGEAIPFVD